MFNETPDFSDKQIAVAILVICGLLYGYMNIRVVNAKMFFEGLLTCGIAGWLLPGIVIPLALMLAGYIPYSLTSEGPLALGRQILFYFYFLIGTRFMWALQSTEDCATDRFISANNIPAQYRLYR